MESKSLILLVVLGAVFSVANSQQQRQQYQRRQLQRQAPQQQPYPEELEEVRRPKVYEVSHQISPNVGDGSFAYRSVMSDGLEAESQGHFANPLQSQVHQGSYTTTDEHGQVVRVDYVADKNGFRPVGQNVGLPVAPAEPEELIRARADILAQQKAIRDEHLGYLRAGYAAAGR